MDGEMRLVILALLATLPLASSQSGNNVTRCAWCGSAARAVLDRGTTPNALADMVPGLKDLCWDRDGPLADAASPLSCDVGVDAWWSGLGAAAIRDFMGLVPAACEDTGDCVRGEQEYIDPDDWDLDSCRSWLSSLADALSSDRAVAAAAASVAGDAFCKDPDMPSYFDAESCAAYVPVFLPAALPEVYSAWLGDGGNQKDICGAVFGL